MNTNPLNIVFNRFINVLFLEVSVTGLNEQNIEYGLSGTDINSTGSR